MTERMVYGFDFTVQQIRWSRHTSKNCKGRNGRGRPKGSKNKNGYVRRKK